MRIAVIGTGISGNVAAWLLCRDHDVHIFEAADYVGGHANTVEVETFGRRFVVDTAFMVYNERTYPNFSRLLRALGVRGQASDMSFSVRSDRTGLEYQGSSINGLFAQRTNLWRPSFYRMLTDIVRFNREARAFLDSDDDDPVLGEFLDRRRYSQHFRDHYLLPMGAAIWSAKPDSLPEFPARFILGFFHNHGLLQMRDRPQWMTISGGARQYVAELTRPFRDRIQVSCPIESVSRHEDHVVVAPRNRPAEVFDHVVFATHADQTLNMLADATSLDREILGCFPYQENEAVLHYDTSRLPRRQRAWASWNYHICQNTDRPVSVTYNLSRLQSLETPHPILLTLNPNQAIDRDKTLRRFVYHHPVFSSASIDAQRRFSEISGCGRTHFCGAYWGHGFHEDGVNSALAIGKTFGIGFEQCTAASTKVSCDTADSSL